MKNAIFKYDYEGYPGYRPATANLGDYIQSIAASQFFPNIDQFIDRDSLSNVTEEISVIGNGWYAITPERHKIPSNLNMLPVSIHINNRSDEIISVIQSWTKNGPIGCRDIATMEFLQRGGIDCYFSSCMTTTLSRNIILKDDVPVERKGVYLADVDGLNSLKLFPLNRFVKSLSRYQVSHLWNKELKKLLQYFDGEKVEKTTHECSLSCSHEQRFELAKDLLRKYATARCVITSRIHCALPCLALGTPVVLVTPTYDTLRYRGIDKFFNHIWIDENGKLSQHIDTLNGEIVNNNEFVKHANLLKQRCFEFTKKLAL